MTISITADRMVSNQTEHYATTAGVSSTAWYVSWFPHLGPFNKNKAVTALLIAEVVLHDGIDSPDSGPLWYMVSGWCNDLGIAPEHAIDMLRSIQ